jgi:hypothetical protein
MATTIPLNSLHTVWVTTYHGGAKGTCFDISVQLNADTQLTATYTVEELVQLLNDKGGHVRGLAKPDFEKKNPSAVKALVEEAEDVISLRNDDQHVGAQPLAQMVLDYFV